NEKPMKWIDDRNHPRVLLLNGLLICLQVKQMTDKVISRTKSFFASRFRKPATQNATAVNS
ncbi:MAG TPA: hypothetical protein VGB71_11980, partial [Flavisolibacter sp.]